MTEAPNTRLAANLAPWRRLRTSSTSGQAVAGIAFALPALVLFAAFSVYPILRTLYLSFFDYDMMTEPVFRGLTNYTSLFADPLFWASVAATVVYIGLAYIPTIVLALGLALLLNRGLPLRSLFRTLYFTPVVLSMVVVAVIWRLVLFQQGPLNVLLGQLGFDPVPWLSNRTWAPVALAIMTSWKSVGYFMVLFLAGLQGIPSEYAQAAMIDGAGRWQIFWNITLPLLKPITVFVVTIALLFGIQEFTAPYVMTGGGPNGATRVISLLVYETAFSFTKMGRATAICVLLFLTLAAITLVQRRWLLATDD